MPLVERNYYTWHEALAKIEPRLPDEAANNNLVDACENGLQSWIIDEKSGTRFEIPHRVWRSKDGLFRYSFDKGTAEIQEQLVRRSAPYSPKSQGTWDKDGNFFPNYIKGELRISRMQLDALLDALPKSSAVGFIKAETDCGKWFKETRQAEGEGPSSKTKDEYFKEAAAKIGPHLSRKSFDKQWDKEAPPSWKKRGPKKRRP